MLNEEKEWAATHQDSTIFSKRKKRNGGGEIEEEDKWWKERVSDTTRFRVATMSRLTKRSVASVAPCSRQETRKKKKWSGGGTVRRPSFGGRGQRREELGWRNRNRGAKTSRRAVGAGIETLCPKKIGTCAYMYKYTHMYTYIFINMYMYIHVWWKRYQETGARMKESELMRQMCTFIHTYVYVHMTGGVTWERG